MPSVEYYELVNSIALVYKYSKVRVIIKNIQTLYHALTWLAALCDGYNLALLR